jgi:hypothetical protein
MASGKERRKRNEIVGIDDMLVVVSHALGAESDGRSGSASVAKVKKSSADASRKKNALLIL